MATWTLVVALLLVVAVGATFGRDAKRTPPIFDCGRDGCRWRGRVNHRHPI